MYVNSTAIEKFKEFITKRKQKRLIKLLIKDWYLSNNLNIGSLQITDMRFKFRPKEIKVIIYLEHSDLLVGMNGSKVVRLEQFLSRMMQRKIKIESRPSQLWNV